MATKSVEVKLSANVAAYKAGMAEASRSTEQLGETTDRTTSQVGGRWSSTGSRISGAMGLSMAAVGAGAVMLAKTSIDAASNLSESINAVNVSYGKSADAVHKLGDTSVESFGLSQRAFNEAAVSFTSFAENIAGDGGDVATTLDDLMTRSTDFASVMNMDVTEAADAFKSALSGEAEPLKAFGIDISDAAMKAHALATGLAVAGREMTDQEKVQARYSLLMKETAKTAGDFANTNDGYANSMKMLKAETENLAAAFGEKLLPMLADLATNLTQVVDVLQDMQVLDAASFWMKWANPITHASNVTSALKGETDLLGREFRNTTQAAWDYAEAVEAQGGSFDVALEAFEMMEDATAASIKSTQEAVAAAIQQAWANEVAGSSYVQVAGAIEDATAARKAADEADGHSVSVYAEMEAGVRAIITALDEEAAAILAVSDARRQSTADIYDARDAEDAWWAQLAKTNELLTSTEASEREKAAATRDMALATDEVVTAQLTANGVNLETVAGQEAWLDAMLDVAAGLSGPMHDEVMSYIALMSGIPASKLTMIHAELDFKSVEWVKASMEALFAAGVTVPVRASSLPNSKNKKDGAGAWGVHALAGKTYEVGEYDRPEMFSSGGRSFLIPGNNGRVEPISPVAATPSAGVIDNRQNVVQLTALSRPSTPQDIAQAFEIMELSA